MMSPPSVGPRWMLTAVLYGVLGLGALAVAAFAGFEIGGEATGVARVLSWIAAAFIALFAVIPFRAAAAFARRSPMAARHIRATGIGCLFPLFLMALYAALGFIRSLLAGEPIFQILAVLAVVLALMGVWWIASIVGRRIVVPEQRPPTTPTG